MSKYLIFDLGGVLVGLPGIARMLEWTGLSEEECWSRWMHSEAIMAFESGKLGASDFARSAIQEFKLPVGEKQFLEEFTQWPSGFFRGAKTLLKTLRKSHGIACLTNINELHWERARHEWKVYDCFDHCIASHEVGLVKPDPAIFRLAAERVGEKPSNILYFDDNALNVKAASESGMTAFRVRGLTELKTTIDATLGAWRQ